MTITLSPPLGPRLTLPKALWVPGRFPNLNDLLDARSKAGGTGYNTLKKQWQHTVGFFALAQGFGRAPLPRCAITFLHYEADARRDPDGICGGTGKVVLDSLVKLRVLQSDGWKWVADLRHHWVVAASPTRAGVLTVFDVSVWDRERMLAAKIP